MKKKPANEVDKIVKKIEEFQKCLQKCAKDRLKFEEQKCAISEEFDGIDAFMVNKIDYIYF